MSTDRKTQPILITGANRGIGRAAAERLVREGWAVITSARRAEDAEQTAADLRDAGAHAPRPLELDLSRRDSIEATCAWLRKEEIPLGALVNNGAIYPKGDALEVPEDEIQDALKINLFAPWVLARGVLPGMAERGYGRIVNVSSGYGSFASGLGGAAAYSVTKAAINAVTVKLAQVAPAGVKINTMSPGWVRTRMGGDNADRSPEEGADTIVWLATLPDDGPSGSFFRDRKPIDW